MQETQTQYGEKYIILIATSQKEMLGHCYSNEHMETYTRIEILNKIILLFYEKPLAVLSANGYGFTAQRHVVVYRKVAFNANMGKYSITRLREQGRRKNHHYKSANRTPIVPGQSDLFAPFSNTNTRRNG